MNSIICQAIAARRAISFFYNGGVRHVEPHCHGISTAGNEVLRAYQTAGYSESGNSTGWKLFEVDEMDSIQILSAHFPQNRPYYNPNDKGMSQVHCHV